MAFIQVPPDSTGKLVDTTLISGQHRENICVGDPTTAAALGSVVRTPNADIAAGNPLAASGRIFSLGSVLALTTGVSSYAPAVAGSDGMYGRVLQTDSLGRAQVAAEGNLLEKILNELRNIKFSVLSLNDSGAALELSESE